ncbi:uncharacterized protein CHPS25_1014 [Chlamydia psittaci]|nr:uncharacterized protein CHPS25_1014 [Chlamydia psittaci]ATQ73059.1 uncharacterized protein CHPS23_1016 [Chlamydia psittaci]ATQ80303.1 uncharacterized protein CHPS1_1017 [Chlamydia psittaci]
MTTSCFSRCCPTLSNIPLCPDLTTCCDQIRLNATKLHNSISLLGNVFGILGSSTMIAKASLNPENTNTLMRLTSLENACGIAVGLNSCVDTVTLVSQLLTGAMFYEVDSATGSFKIVTKNIQKPNGEVEIVSSRILRSPLAIASKVTRLASKATGSACLLSDLKLVNLAKHAKGLGGISTGLSAISSACGAVDDVISIVSTLRSTDFDPSYEDLVQRRVTLREKFFSLLCNFVDLVADILCLFANFAPALLGPQSALIIGSFFLMSAVLNFVQDSMSL